MSRKGLALLLSLSLLVWGPPRSAAQAVTPVEIPQLVYDLQVFTAQGYQEAFYPRSAGPITVLAGYTNVFLAVRTRVYYWPPQGRYLADWAALDVPVGGDLEVTQAGRLIKQVAPETYVLWYPEGLTGTATRLLLGHAAEQAYASYQRSQDAYSRAAAAYRAAMQAYRAAVQRFLRTARSRRQHAGPTPPLPVPREPVQPQPPAGYATSPALAYPLTLPAGRYDVVMRDAAGRVVAASRRAVVVLGGRRSGVSYTVMPEDRWTLPVTAADPIDVVYLARSDVLYVQAAHAAGYDAAGYARLQDPQGSGAAAGWTWVDGAPLDGRDLLEVRQGGRVTARLARRPYYVQESSGAALGYSVDEYDAHRFPGQSPTFWAYRVPRLAGAGATIDLLTPDGHIVPGSTRTLRRVQPSAQGGTLFAPALLPLILGLLVSIGRDLLRPRGR